MSDLCLLRPRRSTKLALVFGLPFLLVATTVLAYLLLSAVGVPIGVPLKRPASDGSNLGFGAVVYICFVVAVISYALVAVLLLVFRRVSFGRINGSRTVELRPLIGKWRVLRFQELLGYSECSYPAWARHADRGKGLALYHANGSHIQLNDYHLNGVEEFKALLNTEGVRFLGKETCWWYPIMKRRFKFDPK